MGNKTSSSNLNYNDEFHSNIDSLFDRNSCINSSKKYGQSPRFRRRHQRQGQIDKKNKRLQVRMTLYILSIYLSISQLVRT